VALAAFQLALFQLFQQGVLKYLELNLFLALRQVFQDSEEVHAIPLLFCLGFYHQSEELPSLLLNLLERCLMAEARAHQSQATNCHAPVFLIASALTLSLMEEM
jgi:hypothetical protein